MEQKNIILTAEQRNALELIKKSSRVLLSGGAGVGKSVIIRTIIAEAKAEGKSVVVAAPTGIAAINVGGSTLHRVFHIPVKPIVPMDLPKDASQEIALADIIIVDEISMCRADTFEYIMAALAIAEKEHGKKQLIVVGDFLQLPPVVREQEQGILSTAWGYDLGEGFAFLTKAWRQNGFVVVSLDENMRQKGDEDFIHALHDVRVGRLSGIDWINGNYNLDIPGKDTIYLCGTRREAERINARELNKLLAQKYIYRASVVGKVGESDKMVPDTMELRVGCRVMSVVNSSDGRRYQNGSMGTVLELGQYHVVVQFDNGEKESLPYYTWHILDYHYNQETKKLEACEIGRYTQIPLRVAYASTIHKSQGLSLESAIVNPCTFVPGQLYVALSRVRTIEGLHLTRMIQPKDLRVSMDAVCFLNGGRSLDTESDSRSVTGLAV